MTTRSDCRHFLGHRPCDHHKRHGIPCTECPDFRTRGAQTLIIHYGAAGDILRTLFIASKLKKQDPDLTLTWLTAPAHMPLFQDIPDIDRVLPATVNSVMELLARRFSRLINLEMDPAAAGLAMRIQSDRKDGFGLNPDGFLVPFNPAGHELYSLSTDDTLKKANQLTRQQLLLNLLELPGPPTPPLLFLTENEQSAGRLCLEKMGLETTRGLIGLNVGSGRRWTAKRWPLENFRRLDELLRIHNLEPVYLAGPSEPELIEKMRQANLGPLISPDLSLREFASVLAQLPVVVTADTMALHMTLAAGGRVVALFGPTSAAEIALFDRGEKLQAAESCQCYYHRECSHDPSCMSGIEPRDVCDAVIRQLTLSAGTQ